MASDYPGLAFLSCQWSATHSSCRGPFPRSCSCLFCFTISLVTFLGVKWLLLSASWYFLSEIQKSVHWTRQSQETHILSSWALPASDSDHLLVRWKCHPLQSFLLMWWNQKADTLAHGSWLMAPAGDSVTEWLKVEVEELLFENSTSEWSTSKILTRKPTQSRDLKTYVWMLMCQDSLGLTLCFLFIHQTQVLWLEFYFCMCVMF